MHVARRRVSMLPSFQMRDSGEHIRLSPNYFLFVDGVSVSILIKCMRDPIVVGLTKFDFPLIRPMI